ncbi:hypothetical protein Esi_0213_0033 [Ectocarpus siliculosus]|uniref:Uncharacterized protein n=1 Tax=Ectocarpus siliculosus TaxID=2880 RepID=D7FRD7_ECTSI|nr:hypothetical protein Esi_0213_0033 [Ectocarpus siliculosus]|eukprot:CBJ30728.1 hypothetical protein Esi_0213_0033 [Ectocarpus siliculosus]
MTPTSAPAALPVAAAKALAEARMDSQKAGTRDQTHLRLRHRSGKGENRHPAALLKVHRPAVKHSKDSTNHSKKGKRNGEKGGSTDVAILHDVGQIEQALINAGKAVRQSPPAMGTPDSVTAQLQQPQQMPRRPTSRAYINDNEGLAADLSRDHCGPGAQDIAPKNDQSRQYPSQGDNVTLEALIINDEVARFRTALLFQEQVAAATALTPQRQHQRRGSIHDAATNCSAQTSGERVAVDDTTDACRAIGKDGASLVEARALAVLRQRDRVRLYDSVPLCGACYREYSDNWRWWLARGEQGTKTKKEASLRSSEGRQYHRKDWGRQRAHAIGDSNGINGECPFE